LPEAGFDRIQIDSNAGFFRFFSQESIRFLRNTRPFALRMSLAAELLWAPLWLLLMPILGILIPVACAILDRFDREKRFTVGYHVTARRMPMEAGRA
jgi:hypothetical protein